MGDGRAGVGPVGMVAQESRTWSVFHSLPWLVGWVSLTVMGPWVAAKIIYQTCNLVLSWIFQKDEVLRGKVVFVTGASSGLGEALAHSLYKRGARLILAARNIEKLNEIKETLLKTYRPPEVHLPIVVKLDLEDLNSIDGIVQDLLNTVGHIDILINNAGISYRGTVDQTDISVDIKLMVVNYFGQVALTKAVLPSMKARKEGTIIAVSSIQGKLAIPFRSCYAASKHALQAFFDTLRAEVYDDNIKVSVISPGYIATNLSVNAVTSDGSNYGVMDPTTSSGTEPDKVAEQILNCLITGEEEILLCPFAHRLAVYLRNLMPSVIFSILKRRARKQNETMKKNK
ncbi:dehydrogenase/reductase SDR family protein 7-like [Oratosquilla oratoria]|uniref:dehydrogenase/reductase SDR family protein 7-like n=1 Tax=Oratosquilla oratoria TaxID=337810 RepID=UPI003F77176C